MVIQKRYEALTATKAKYKARVMNLTGWSVPTFYIKLKTAETLPPIELECLTVQMQRFEKLETKLLTP